MGTILHILNTLQVQFNDANGNLCQKNIPFVIPTKEKSILLEDYTDEQLLTSNTNIIPRGFLRFTNMTRADSRMMNKNVKINAKRNKNSLDYQYNSVPYDFNFDCMVKCRGLSEACMIMEEVVSLFNPNLNIEIYDADYEDAPTDITIKLLDLNPEFGDYDEYSHNIIEVTFAFCICGWIYYPVRNVERIKEVLLHVYPEDNDDHFTIGYDVEDGHLVRENFVDKIRSMDKLCVTQVKIKKHNKLLDTAVIGTNTLDIKVQKLPHVDTKLTLEVCTGNAIIVDDKLVVKEADERGEVTILATLSDEYKNEFKMYKRLKVLSDV